MTPVLFPVSPGLSPNYPFWGAESVQRPTLIAGGQLESMLEDLATNRIPLRDEVSHSDIRRIPIPESPVQRISDASQLQDTPPIMGRGPGVGLMDMLTASIVNNRLLGEVSE